MLSRKLILTNVSLALVACAGIAFASSACFVDFPVNCGSLHANTGRNCINGTNIVPCGDIILSSENTKDIRLAMPLEAGLDNASWPCCLAHASVWVFNCLGGTCNSAGVQQFTCQGREAVGNSCVGIVTTSE